VDAGTLDRRPKRLVTVSASAAPLWIFRRFFTPATVIGTPAAGFSFFLPNPPVTLASRPSNESVPVLPEFTLNVADDEQSASEGPTDGRRTRGPYAASGVRLNRAEQARSS
jgi:hypothetical protein